MDVRGQPTAASVNHKRNEIATNASTNSREFIRNTKEHTEKANCSTSAQLSFACEQLQQQLHVRPNKSNNMKNRETDSYKEENLNFIWSNSDGVTTTTTPAADHEDEFLTLLEHNDMLFVSGDAGTGKSITLTLSLLTDAKRNDKPISILSFQADSAYAFLLAQFCCEIRGEDIGDVIGYRTHYFSKPGKNLTFLPYQEGALANRFQKNLQRYTHIIMDDVYMQANGFEQVLLLCKETIAMERHKGKGGPKLIFMSSTFSYLKELIVFYMPDLSHDSIHVGENRFNVDVLRLSDVAVLASSKIAELDAPAARSMMLTRDQFLNSTFEDGKPTTPASTNHLSFNSHTMADVAIIRERFETQLVTETLNLPYFGSTDVIFGDPETVEFLLDVVWFCCRSEYRKGSVLVFLPGASECENAAEKFNASRNTTDDPYAFALHSRIQHADQMEIFDPPTDSGARVIFATALAETSVTMPDISFVIDCAKNGFFDYSTRETEDFDWTSRQSHEQRKGRVGRVKPGVYIELVHEEAKNYFPALSIPAVSFQPLSDLLLTLSPRNRSGFSPLQRARRLFIPPHESEVREAVEELVAHSALRPGRDQDSYVVTSLGRLALRSGHIAKEQERTMLEHISHFMREDSDSSSDNDDSNEWDDSESSAEEDVEEEQGATR